MITNSGPNPASLDVPPLRYLIAAICFLLFASGTLTADDPTPKEKRSVKSIGKIIDRAGRLFKSKKLEAAADKISEAQKKLAAIADGADAELLALVKPEYSRLSTAHKLLTESGQKLAKLLPLPAPVAVNGDAKISFKSQVAPILLSNCGNCHVRQQRGEFSAANYGALMDSTHIATGKPKESRIVEVIVDGEMPPGNKSVPEKDLEVLKQWIAEGAKFDGDDPTANLNSLGPAMNNNARPMAIAKPTGSETVSFGKEVAPVLIEKCGSCHIDRDRPQGNFSMANFRRMLRGGDGGSPIAAGDAMNSALIARLHGDGVRVMPPRNKLDEKTISMIETWINEGAKFDGDDARKPTKTIAAVAKANSQTHSELFASRTKLAEKNWKLVMSEDVENVVASENVRVIGSADKDRVKKIQSMLEDLAGKTAEVLKLKSEGALIKGGATFFVFERRYDFNELGVMIVGHDLPKDVVSHWNSDTVDAFGSLLLTKNKEPESAYVELTIQLGALYAASMAPDTPRWFSDGVGHYVAARILPRDEQVKSWDNQSAEVISQLKNPADLINGKLGEKKTALASFHLVRQLKSAQLTRLLQLTREKVSFTDAFQELFGKPPSEYFRPQRPKRSRPR